jgi:HK97 family phage major capsid protein
MMYGLKKKEDLEILFGDGLGSHLTGLTVDATAFAGTYNVASDTYIDKILRALTELEATSEYQATGIVVNPADWRKMQSIKEDVSAANTGQYILGGPRTQGPMQLWDVPVVTTTAMTVGRFLVGDFQQAGEIFDRMDATVDISTEHSDYFIKNLVAVRIEERLALAVYRPNAMRYGSF